VLLSATLPTDVSEQNRLIGSWVATSSTPYDREHKYVTDQHKRHTGRCLDGCQKPALSVEASFEGHRFRMTVLTPSTTQSYAQSFVTEALGSIKKGLLIFVLRYNKDEKIYCGVRDDTLGPHATIYVNKPSFWLRILMAFDLVCQETLVGSPQLLIALLGILRIVYVAGY